LNLYSTKYFRQLALFIKIQITNKISIISRLKLVGVTGDSHHTTTEKRADRMAVDNDVSSVVLQMYLLFNTCSKCEFLPQ